MDSCQIPRLIVFAVSDNLSGENSKLPADFRIHRIPLLECMVASSSNKGSQMIYTDCLPGLNHPQRKLIISFQAFCYKSFRAKIKSTLITQRQNLPEGSQYDPKTMCLIQGLLKSPLLRSTHFYAI